MIPSTIPSDLFKAEIARNVGQALMEDIGSGDLTASLIDAKSSARGQVIARERGILCGQAWFETTFRVLEPQALIKWNFSDGEIFEADQILCEVECRARTMLTAERTALNFLQMLSGIATQTRAFVKAVQGTKAKIVDTRKTIPGLRLAQKYAVRVGGGENHRIGLFDGILIKENHILAAGGIQNALRRAAAMAPPHIPVQVEVETLAQLEEAISCGVKMILLDNMSITQLREAVIRTGGRAILEASGGITLESVRTVAETGVDRISIGRLTKDIRAIDLSLRFI